MSSITTAENVLSNQHVLIYYNVKPCLHVSTPKSGLSWQLIELYTQLIRTEIQAKWVQDPFCPSKAFTISTVLNLNEPNFGIVTCEQAFRVQLQRTPGYYERNIWQPTARCIQDPVEVFVNNTTLTMLTNLSTLCLNLGKIAS